MKCNSLMKRICLAMLFAVGVLSASALAQQSGGVAGEGGAIFAQQECASCHGQSGQGGRGPKLRGNERLSDIDYVIHQLRYGGSGMPPFGKKLSAQQIADVATFVRTSWGNSFGKVTKAEVEQGGVSLVGGAGGKNGKQVYARSGCARCHGASGQGAIGPKLAGNDKLRNGGFVIAQVLHGGGIMPPFADRLSNKQIADVATYIRTSWGNTFGKVTQDTVEVARGGSSGGKSGGSMSGGSGGQSGAVAANGKQIYAQHGCASCHGSSGEGGLGPRLSGDGKLKHTAFVITQILRGGGPMPAFAGRLSAAQIADVATYIRTSWGNSFGKVTQVQVKNPQGGLSGGASGGQQSGGGQSGGQAGGRSGGAEQPGEGQSGGQSGGAVSGGQSGGVSGAQSGGAASGGAMSGGASSSAAVSGGASGGTSSMTFTATLTGKHEAPPTNSKATGKATATLKGHTLTVHGSFQGLSSHLFKVAGTPAHIHQAPTGLNGPIVFKLVVQPGGESGGASGGQATSGTFKGTFTLTNAQIKALKAANFYINVHTENNPNGEIRGQLLASQGGASGGGQSGGR